MRNTNVYLAQTFLAKNTETLGKCGSIWLYRLQTLQKQHKLMKLEQLPTQL